MSTIIKTDITNIGDPFVLLAGDTYYMYATSSKDGFFVWKSDDLKSWEKLGMCYDVAANGEAAFGYECFWAPEVVFHNGKYIMHYTARWKKNKSLRTGVAVSDSPTGPFLDVKPNEPMFDFGYAAIDGHCFIDDDGQGYLYYTKDVAENIVDGVHYSDIYVVKLSQDLCSVAGEAVKLTTPEQEWETTEDPLWKWNEGPFVIKNDGKYILTYSGNAFFHRNYGIGSAVSDSPMGAFVKFKGNPVLKCKGDISGPGHHNIFNDKNGQQKAAFHIHTDPTKTTGDRRACICDIKIKNGTINFIL